MGQQTNGLENTQVNQLGIGDEKLWHMVKSDSSDLIWGIAEQYSVQIWIPEIEYY